ncbi:MAG: YbaB/EbfC family nucleoid-associated protein [Verrucomicrobiae bacterium]|nr:YbaB/EbfC family nucleoid-associated protein [Verrucomicrobiae bacterium]
MNIAKMMKQAQQMQAKMQSMQAELAEKTIETSVGGGKVTVTANGAGDVISIRIDPAVVDPEDVEMLEDLVLSGVKQAIEQGKAMAAAEMQKITAGLGLPPGMGF